MLRIVQHLKKSSILFRLILNKDTSTLNLFAFEAVGRKKCPTIVCLSENKVNKI